MTEKSMFSAYIIIFDLMLVDICSTFIVLYSGIDIFAEIRK